MYTTIKLRSSLSTLLYSTNQCLHDWKLACSLNRVRQSIRPVNQLTAHNWSGNRLLVGALLIRLLLHKKHTYPSYTYVCKDKSNELNVQTKLRDSLKCILNKNVVECYYYIFIESFVRCSSYSYIVNILYSCAIGKQKGSQNTLSLNTCVHSFCVVHRTLDDCLPWWNNKYSSVFFLL